MAAFSGRAQLGMPEEIFDFECTACARDEQKIEAVTYCIECGGYCCQSCVDAHRKFPTLNGHNFMDVAQSDRATYQQSTVTEFPTERCSNHKSKVVDMYCEDHDAVGCYICFAKDHKFCNYNGIHSVPDMINNIFNLSDCTKTSKRLKETMVHMQEISQSKDATLQVLKNAKEDALEKVEVFKNQLEDIVKKVTAYTRQEVEVAYKELENEITNQKQKVEKIECDLKVLGDKLRQSEGNRAQRFVCSKIIQDTIKEVDTEKMKLNMDKDIQVTLSFCPDQSLMEYINTLQGIGQVQKRGTKDISEAYTEIQEAYHEEVTPLAFPKGKPPQVWCPEEALKFQSKIEKPIRRFHVQRRGIAAPDPRQTHIKEDDW